MRKEKKTDNNISYNGQATVVKGLKSHANDPFFVKKAEDAKAFISKVVFPEHLKK